MVDSSGGFTRRKVLAGLGGAGVLVAAMEIPLASGAGARSTSGANDVVPETPEIVLADVRVRSVFDADGSVSGHVLLADVVDVDGSRIGSFTGTAMGGRLMVHEAIVGDSMLIGMGSTEKFAVVGATGAYAGCTGGYVIEMTNDEHGAETRGRLNFGE
jgi:hypothetical protein